MSIPSGVLDELRIDDLEYRFFRFSCPHRLTVDVASACFVVVIRGSVSIEHDGLDGGIENDRNQTLERGSIVLLPHGDEARLSCGSASAMVSGTSASVVSSLLQKEGGEDVIEVEGDGGDELAEVVVGRFSFVQPEQHPLIATLPTRLQISPENPTEWDWFDACVDMLRNMPNMHPSTSRFATARIVEIAFVRALVMHAKCVIQGSLNESSVARWIKALNDPNLSPALIAMHRQPIRDWTLSKLSREAMLSRTAFTDRFKEMLGDSPMRYLRRLRLSEAQRLLQNDPDATVAEAAAVAGYTSTSSFSQAFKDVVGTSPGDYQRSVND